MKKVRFAFNISEEVIPTARPPAHLSQKQRTGILKNHLAVMQYSTAPDLRRTKSSPIHAPRSCAHHAPTGSLPTISLDFNGSSISRQPLDRCKNPPAKTTRRSFTVGHKQHTSEDRGSRGWLRSWADGPPLTGIQSPYYEKAVLKEPLSPFYRPPGLSLRTRRLILLNHARIAATLLLTLVALWTAADSVKQALASSTRLTQIFVISVILMIEIIHLILWSLKRAQINAASQLLGHSPPIRSNRLPTKKPPQARSGPVIMRRGIQVNHQRLQVTLKATTRGEMVRRGVKVGRIMPLPSVFSSWAAWRRMQRPDVTDGLDIRSYVSAWFRGQPFDEVRQGNVKEFIAYAFFYRTLAEIDRLGLRRLIDSMLEELEETFEISFPRGYNPAISFMGHLREDLRMGWRPLSLFYLPAYITTALGRIMLSALGFSHLQLHSINNPSSLPPWAKRLTNQPGSDSWRIHYLHQGDVYNPLTPILFLHGIGIGHLMYSHLISSLKATGASILSIEHPHISLNLCQAVPTADEVAERIANTLAALGISDVLLFAHSYGCLIASRLLQRRPELVSGLVMADPVCLGMFMPHLVRSAIYRIPQTLKDLLIWTVVREPSAATFFCRSFYWSTINLNVEDLLPGGRTILVLHGKDRFVDVPAVLRWIKSRTITSSSSSIRVVYQPEGTHGALLLNADWMADCVSAIASLLDEIKISKESSKALSVVSAE